MHLLSLKLVCPMVKEKMYLQENTIYDLDLVVKVTQNVVQYPPNHMTYAPAKFEVDLSNSLGEMDLQESTLYDLDLGVKVTQNVAQYHPHHVTYASVNFEVAMSNGSGEDAFTRKYII